MDKCTPICMYITVNLIVYCILSQSQKTYLYFQDPLLLFTWVGLFPRSSAKGFKCCMVFRAKGTPQFPWQLAVASRLGPIFTTLSRKAASKGSDNATPTTPSLGWWVEKAGKGWGRQPAGHPQYRENMKLKDLTNLTSANMPPLKLIKTLAWPLGRVEVWQR